MKSLVTLSCNQLAEKSLNPEAIRTSFLLGSEFIKERKPYKISSAVQIFDLGQNENIPS